MIQYFVTHWFDEGRIRILVEDGKPKTFYMDDYGEQRDLIALEYNELKIALKKVGVKI